MRRVEEKLVPCPRFLCRLLRLRRENELFRDDFLEVQLGREGSLGFLMPRRRWAHYPEVCRRGEDDLGVRRSCRLTSHCCRCERMTGCVVMMEMEGC